MAEAFLSGVAAGLISKVRSLLLDEMVLGWGVKYELGRLGETVETIKTVLLDAEEKSNHNHEVQQWLGELTEAMYDAEDLLDEFSTVALQRQVAGGSKISKEVCLFFSSSNQIAFRLKMGHKIRGLMERFDEIADRRKKFYFEERVRVERDFVSDGRDQTHSSPPKVVIGREPEKEAIVQLLLSSECKDDVSVVSILGFGGLGKTTLAQMVCDDVNVKNHFQLKMWVSATNFDLRSLVKKMIESATAKSVDLTEMDPLKNHLQKTIIGKRYLLVLDDVWSEDVNKWSGFMDLLPGGGKVLITTRLKTVAERSRPIPPHELQVLSSDESWSLFKIVAFKQLQSPSPSLEAMGREIAEKCAGVPLAIKTIAGVLSSCEDSEWELMKRSALSTIDVYKNGILPILKLSYDHLPCNYKRCFAYCSLCPKGYSIRVEELIHLWKAQGYLNSTTSNESLHDIGLRFFMHLHQMSFFQDVEYDKVGNITDCKMHDLMHDLAESVAGDNFFAPHLKKTSISIKTRHVSFHGHRDFNMQHFSSLCGAKKARTVLSLPGYEEQDMIFNNLRCVRALDLSCMGIDRLPSSIGQLKHLRYLDLSGNYYIQELPNSVTSLLNLLDLKLKNCLYLKQLPGDISKLLNLSNLENLGTEALSHMPKGIGKLTRLEKLSKFVIAEDDSISKHSGGLDELQSLNNLRGSLHIKGLRYVKNPVYEFKAARLNEKKKIQKLILNWGEDENELRPLSPHQMKKNFSANDEEMGMEALRPHQNLKHLTVEHYGGAKPPSWISLATSLVSVRLYSCRKIQRLPPFDHFAHLEELHISNLTRLELVDVENAGGSSSFFPSLKDLVLRGCQNLKGFEGLSREVLPAFPCLRSLILTGCPNLSCLPLFPRLKELTTEKEGLDLALGCASSPFSALSQVQELRIEDTKDSLENELPLLVPCLEGLVFSDCSFRTVHSDEKDDGVHWQSFKGLRSVLFWRLKNLVALPKGLQHVTTLQSLEIYECPSLECIPEWMPKLVGLQQLTITRSPQLAKRCEKNRGEDWPKISHIPYKIFF